MEKRNDFDKIDFLTINDQTAFCIYLPTSVALPTFNLILFTAVLVVVEMLLSGTVMLFKNKEVSALKFSTSHTMPVTLLATCNKYNKPKMEHTEASRPDVM